MKDGDKKKAFVKESFIQTVKLYLSKSAVRYILISSVVIPPKMVYDLPAIGGVPMSLPIRIETGLSVSWGDTSSSWTTGFWSGGTSLK